MILQQQIVQTLFCMYAEDHEKLNKILTVSYKITKESKSLQQCIDNFVRCAQSRNVCHIIELCHKYWIDPIWQTLINNTGNEECDFMFPFASHVRIDIVPLETNKNQWKINRSYCKINENYYPVL